MYAVALLALLTLAAFPIRAGAPKGGAADTVEDVDGNITGGVTDMHGNVSEWCADRCEFPILDYPSHGVIDPLGADLGDRRVFRGGNWDGLAQECRCALRLGAYPGGPSEIIGLRVARTAS